MAALPLSWRTHPGQGVGPLGRPCWCRCRCRRCARCRSRRHIYVQGRHRSCPATLTRLCRCPATALTLPRGGEAADRNLRKRSGPCWGAVCSAAVSCGSRQGAGECEQGNTRAQQRPTLNRDWLAPARRKVLSRPASISVWRQSLAIHAVTAGPSSAETIAKATLGHGQDSLSLDPC